MDDIYTYLVPMPGGVREYVTPCSDGYTVYINDQLDEEHRLQAYQHAVHHVQNNDLGAGNVQQIESLAHREQ